MSSFWDMVNTIKEDLEEKEQKEAKAPVSNSLNEAKPKKVDNVNK